MEIFGISFTHKILYPIIQKVSILNTIYTKKPISRSKVFFIIANVLKNKRITHSYCTKKWALNSFFIDSKIPDDFFTSKLSEKREYFIQNLRVSIGACRKFFHLNDFHCNSREGDYYIFRTDTNSGAFREGFVCRLVR